MNYGDIDIYASKSVEPTPVIYEFKSEDSRDVVVLKVCSVNKLINRAVNAFRLKYTLNYGLYFISG